jgi:site-specific DNA-methyltransferase (adenine-specific)/modification methylase
MTTLIQGDCLEVADQIQDGSVDFLLTDPPYNISEGAANPVWKDPETGEDKNTIHNQRFDDAFEQNWDSVSHEQFLFQMTEWSQLWSKKLRKGGSFAVFISDQYVSYLWKIMEDTGFEPKRVWTWKKPAAVPFNRQVNPVSGCEYILWGIKPGGKRTFNSDTDFNSIVDRYAVADKVSSIVYKHIKDDLGSRSIDDIFAAAKAEAESMIKSRKTENGKVQAIVPNTITYSGGLGKDKIHPTQKPTEILEYFIELCTKPGDTVLDTFAGSGSTGIAAKNTGRECVLIERDTKMFDKMKERFVDKTDPLLLHPNLFE